MNECCLADQNYFTLVHETVEDDGARLAIIPDCPPKGAVLVEIP